jgi:hypothetical protein
MLRFILLILINFITVSKTKQPTATRRGVIDRDMRAMMRARKLEVARSGTWKVFFFSGCIP